MKIIVKSNSGKKLCLPIPTGLVVNRLSAGYVHTYLQKYGLHIPKAQLLAFSKALRQCRRRDPKWVLLEVESTDGESVYLKL